MFLRKVFSQFFRANFVFIKSLFLIKLHKNGEKSS